MLSCAAVKERVAIKECTFALLSVTAHDFTFSNVKIDFEIEGRNPNKIDAKLDRLVYTFFVNQTDVFSGTTGKGITIPAGKSEKFTTTITLEYNKIGDVLIEAIKFKKADYEITARAYISTILGEISYPINIGVRS
jgi:LEA14-like dessication related protein